MVLSQHRSVNSTQKSYRPEKRCTYSCKRSDHLDRHMEKIHNERRENKGKQNRRLAIEGRPAGEQKMCLEISQSMSEGTQGPDEKVSIGRIEIINEESPNNNLCLRLVSKYNYLLSYRYFRSSMTEHKF